MSFFNSIVSAFKGGEGARAPLVQGAMPGWMPAFEDAVSYRQLRYEDAVTCAYLQNPIAQRAVRIVAEGVGQAPVVFDDSSVSKLVQQTSASQSLVEALAVNILLHGNGFIQIIKDGAGQPIELFSLRPDRVKIEKGTDGWPRSFVYCTSGEPTIYPIEDENGWPNIIHIRAMHPTDDYLGASALTAAQQPVAIHNAASQWNLALLENAARPSGALIYETDEGAALTNDQFERLKTELETAFSGAANAGRPMLLDGGLKWQKIAMSPADMDFAALKGAAARDIALAFGVPPMLLGLPGDNTYSNYREANRALWRLTLLPLASKIYSAIQEGLAPWFPDSKIAIDLDQITALSEDRERLWKQVSEADFLTRSEKRQLLGFPADEERSL